MKTIMIGSARSMSLGRVASVSEQEFYNHPKKWYVIHAKKKTHRHSLCLDMRNACANDHLMYSQDRRAEIYKRGTDAKVDTYCDCSSLVTQIIRECMMINFPNCTTYSLPQEARKSGLFSVYEYTPGIQLWNGDILCTQTKGHVVIVTRNGLRNVQ